MRNDVVSPEELKALLTKEEFDRLKASTSADSVREVMAMTPLQATEAILELQATVRELTERLDRLTQPQSQEEAIPPESVAPVEAARDTVTSSAVTRTRRYRKKPLWKRLFK